MKDSSVGPYFERNTRCIRPTVLYLPVLENLQTASFVCVAASRSLAHRINSRVNDGKNQRIALSLRLQHINIKGYYLFATLRRNTLHPVRHNVYPWWAG
jgi:hypothetical protein